MRTTLKMLPGTHDWNKFILIVNEGMVVPLDRNDVLDIFRQCALADMGEMTGE